MTRMNGLNKKQLQQGLIFKCLLVSIITLSGCNNWNWTDIEYTNISNNRLRVDVSGVSPDISPGNMAPNTDGAGSKAGLHFGDPVHLSDNIIIGWTIGSEQTKYKKEFKRNDLGIPAIVKGGKIEFIYTEDNDWEIKYSR
ncbi:MAG: hypothetical protein JXB18_02595 [Sedimentisphaerales bacterium]|nr:hypothetical protein [Sedimentisphaerales bacterium]